MRFTIFFLLGLLPFSATAVEIPSGTSIYLTTNDTVVAKGDTVNVGMLVRSRVSRDVTIDGQTVIKAGTPALVKVSRLKKRRVAGMKGELGLTAMETEAVDGQKIFLSGGYNKDGQSRVGWAVGVGVLVAWPVIFLPGTAAELPAGTMISAYVDGTVDVQVQSRAPTRRINLSGMMQNFSAEVLYEELAKVKKPKHFDFKLIAPAAAPDEFLIDSVNGNEIQPMKMETVSIEKGEDEKTVFTRIEIKPLSKEFKKGINRFDVAYKDAEGDRQSYEILLDIEF